MSPMTHRRRHALLALLATLGAVTAATAVAYAAVTVYRKDGQSDHIALTQGPATLTYRELNTPAEETTGAWHYHPGYVYNVVKSGTITIEDGCGEIRSYSEGEAFETSEGRVHRAYNLGDEDAIEHNMFVTPQGRPITVSVPGNVRLCGPVSTVDECKRRGWTRFNHPHPFANQGECVAYVRRRATSTVLVPEDPLP